MFDDVAFACDKKGKLWVLGGWLATKDESVFPMNFGETDFFHKPTKTRLTEAVKDKL